MSKKDNIESEEETSATVNTDIVQPDQQAAEYLAGWQRAQADYANLRKELDQYRQAATGIVTGRLMMDLLPVYNHLQLALGHVPADQAETPLVVGLGQIRKQFAEVIKSHGVVEMETVGQPFDPARHEAISHDEQASYEPDTVYEQVSAGYLIGDQVLIPARVKVAK